MIKKKIDTFLLITILSLLVGCGKMNSYSPEQVITNALESENVPTYYGELKMTMDNVEELQHVTVTEWRHQDKSRVEMMSGDDLTVMVHNGASLTLYEENENKAFVFEDDDMSGLNMNPREQVEMLLDMIRDTHDIEKVGEAEIAGRPAFHMVAKKRKDEKSLFGDQELWIDKEHWVVLKMKSRSGDTQSDIEYTKIDFDTKMDESVFEMELPDDVVIENMDDLNAGTEEELTLEEIPDKIGQSVLYIPDGKSHKMDKITFMEIQGEPIYKDVTIDYKQDGLPLMTLTIISTDGMEEEEEATEVLDDSFEKETIRGKEGLLTEMDQFRSISWDEGGLRYSINIIDPNTTWEMVKEWASHMKKIN